MRLCCRVFDGIAVAHTGGYGVHINYACWDVAVVRIAACSSVSASVGLFAGSMLRIVLTILSWSALACPLLFQDGAHLYDLGAGGIRVGPPASGVQSDVNQWNLRTAITNSLLEFGA